MARSPNACCEDLPHALKASYVTTITVRRAAHVAWSDGQAGAPISNSRMDVLTPLRQGGNGVLVALPVSALGGSDGTASKPSWRCGTFILGSSSWSSRRCSTTSARSFAYWSRPSCTPHSPHPGETAAPTEAKAMGALPTSTRALDRQGATRRAKRAIGPTHAYGVAFAHPMCRRLWYHMAVPLPCRTVPRDFVQPGDKSRPLACVLCSSWVPLALRCRALDLLSLMTSGGSSLRSRASFLG